MALTPLGSNAVANNDRAEKMSRRRRQARRRSGRFTPVAMGAAGGAAASRARQMVTHENISEQVTETIKLHVENKISEKNAFSLPLNGMLKSTNTKFQRAGVILEAGTMIYGKRVDSTMVDSLKVRENLMRTKSAEVDDKGKGVIKTNVSKKVCVMSTIEKNLDNITEKRRNQAFAVDPLFRQMSQKFNDGGAQGMLLNALPVKQGCFVAFDSAQALFTDPAAITADDDNSNEDPDNEQQQQQQQDSAVITMQLPASALSAFHQAAERAQQVPMCSAMLDVLYNEAAADEPFKASGNASTVPSMAEAEAQAQVVKNIVVTVTATDIVILAVCVVVDACQRHPRCAFATRPRRPVLKMHALTSTHSERNADPLQSYFRN